MQILDTAVPSPQLLIVNQLFQHFALEYQNTLHYVLQLLIPVFYIYGIFFFYKRKLSTTANSFPEHQFSRWYQHASYTCFKAGVDALIDCWGELVFRASALTTKLQMV